MFRAVNGEYCTIGDAIAYTSPSGCSNFTNGGIIEQETDKMVVLRSDSIYVSGERVAKNRICAKENELEANYIMAISNDKTPAPWDLEDWKIYTFTMRKSFIDSLHIGDWIVIRTTFPNCTTQRPALVKIKKITVKGCSGIGYPDAPNNMQNGVNKRISFDSNALVAKCTQEYMDELDKLLTKE